MSGDMKHRLSVAESLQEPRQASSAGDARLAAALPADSMDATENLQGRYPAPMRILPLRR
jgi:hypothetical protein